MADQNSEEEQLRLRRFSKENRWYFKTISDHLQPASRKLLEEYSHIPPSEVDSHVYKMVLIPLHFFNPNSDLIS
jgi:hypothetical protein